MLGIYEMIHKNHEKILQKLIESKKQIKIPNDPSLTGTGDWQDRKLLSEKEMQYLKDFLFLIKECNFVCRETLPSSDIAGIYQWDDIYISVSDQWNEVNEDVTLYASKISSDVAKKYLLKTIEELKQIVHITDTRKFTPSAPKNSKREKQIENLINNRIYITTLSKFTGWGNLARKMRFFQKINLFTDLLGVYPSDEQIISMAEFRHPQLNIGIKRLQDDIEVNENKIFIPNIENLEMLTKEETLLCESLREYFKDYIFFGSYLNKNQIEIFIFMKCKNLFIEFALIEVANPKSGDKSHSYYVRKLVHSDLKKIEFLQKNVNGDLFLEEGHTAINQKALEALKYFTYDPLNHFIDDVHTMQNFETLIDYEEKLESFGNMD